MSRHNRGLAQQPRRLATAASSKAWARYTYMLHVHNPRWATSAAAFGLHYGQEYGVPLGIGIGEEASEGLAGDKADKLFPPTGPLNLTRP